MNVYQCDNCKKIIEDKNGFTFNFEVDASLGNPNDFVNPSIILKGHLCRDCLEDINIIIKFNDGQF